MLGPPSHLQACPSFHVPSGAISGPVRARGGKAGQVEPQEELPGVGEENTENCVRFGVGRRPGPIWGHLRTVSVWSELFPESGAAPAECQGQC